MAPCVLPSLITVDFASCLGAASHPDLLSLQQRPPGSLAPLWVTGARACLGSAAGGGLLGSSWNARMLSYRLPGGTWGPGS